MITLSPSRLPENRLHSGCSDIEVAKETEPFESCRQGLLLGQAMVLRKQCDDDSFGDDGYDEYDDLDTLW